MRKIGNALFWIAIGFTAYPLVWCPILIGVMPFWFEQAYLELYGKYLDALFKVFGVY